jgi:PTH1 family peptidyl-tRNA hydrolase
MNVSGPWVTKEITSFASSLGASYRGKLPVAILHDSLEHAAGDLRLLSMAKSAAGHNGIKSIKQNLPGLEQKLKKKGVELVVRRVAIGIGRPASRDATDVSNWVLRKMSGSEVGKIEGQAGKAVGLLGDWVEEEEEEEDG